MGARAKAVTQTARSPREQVYPHNPGVARQISTRQLVLDHTQPQQRGTIHKGSASWLLSAALFLQETRNLRT